jgi:dihydrofolate synthase/folylpolyglutamate synthase
MISHDSLEYLSKLKLKGINLGLGPVARLLERFDNPQRKYRSVLIGGTNGKGSVAAILSSILAKEGLKVGLYTSPHLVDFRERIRVNNSMISGDDLCCLIDKVREKVREDVTYFEFATALAFLYFFICKVDIAILEVGMGGRLDATNLVIPEVSVITNISLEHRKYLGNDLKSIAREKGGIISPGGICLTAAKQPVVLDVLDEICGQKAAVLYRMGRDIRIRKKNEKFSYYGIDKIYRNMDFNLIGRHQLENAALALASVEVLISKGLKVGNDSVISGVRDARWEGRLEILDRNPTIVVDGAHNPAGISALCKALSAEFSYDRLIVVSGVLEDKDYKAMVRILASLADHIILTRIQEERALAPELMEPLARIYNDSVEIACDSRKALLRARDIAGSDDLVCVTGSLYLVGEIKKLLIF